MTPWRLAPPIASAPHLVACATLVAAPLIAFQAVPKIGIADGAMVLPLAILAAFYVTTPRVRVPGWEFALLALLTLSVLWSDVPGFGGTQLRSFVPMAAAVVMAAAILPARTTLTCLKISFAVLVISSVIYLGADPGQALRVKGGGTDFRAQFDKNTYGGVLAVAMLLTLHHYRRLNLLIVPSLVVLLALNRSATAWVVTTLLAGTFYLCRYLIARLGPSARPQLILLGAFGTSMSALLAFKDPDTLLGFLGKSDTLTGRTQIWAACWPLVKADPLLGHGAFSFLNGASNSPVTQAVWAQFVGYRPPHPHNGFLDLAGQLGVVGVVVYAGLLAVALQRGSRAALRGDNDALIAIVCLGFVLLFGVTEPTYLGKWLIVTLMLVAIADPTTRLPTTDVATPRAATGPLSPPRRGPGSGDEPGTDPGADDPGPRSDTQPDPQPHPASDPRPIPV